MEVVDLDDDVESMLSSAVKCFGEQTNLIGNTTVADIKYVALEVRNLQERVANLSNLVEMLHAIRRKTVSREEACKIYIE